ncbi:MAG: class B sortase [Candidatus Ventricola sp.]
MTASPDPTNAAMLPEYAALAAQNPEMIGWIRIEDTRISYPVMQTPEDPQFYLHRGFDRAYAFEGVPFLDARCDPALPSDNLIIYGHNMRSGSMFGTLKEYLNEEFYLAHPLIQFDTLARRGVYRVFAVIPVVLGEMEDERMRCYGVSMTQDEEQLALLEEYVRRYAVLSSPQSLPAVGGEVITLSTCTGFRGANRLVVMAARERQEPGD